MHDPVIPVDSTPAPAATPPRHINPADYRHLKRRAHCAEQTLLYAPCPCGSGRKLKFCCRGKVMEAPNA